jgi:hypothetical protein
MSPNRMDDLELNNRKVNVAMGRIRDFMHKIKERIKGCTSERHRETEEEKDEPACPDWILTNEGECYARKRSSFTKYNTFTGSAGEKHEPTRNGIWRYFHSAPRGGESVPPGRNKVIGIGDVELTVKRHRDKNDNFTRSLKLENVLHLPDSPCNGFNPGTLRKCTIKTEGEGKGKYTEGLDIFGDPWWHAKPFHGRMRLALAFDPPGKTILKKNYVPLNGLNVALNEGEQDTIHDFLKMKGCSVKTPVAVDESAVFTTSGPEATAAPAVKLPLYLPGSSVGLPGGLIDLHR